MALETLVGVTEIDGFKVAHMDKLKEQFPEMVAEDGVTLNWKFFEKEIRPNYPIQVRQDKNSIAFTIQNGPVKEYGVNGCQVDTIAVALKMMVADLNKAFPCEENAIFIYHMGQAIEALKDRKKRREDSGIEGTNKEDPRA